jgi:DNA-binding winged helix-turn-helix (wHTH) protein/tetratricopeptide (TPR) repeat protein
MASEPQITYKFGDFVLLSRDRQLFRLGKPVGLKPKVFQTLLLLVQEAGHLIEKDLFLKHLWPDSFVDEAGLAQNISQIRKVLSSERNEKTYIETVPRLGYRFVAPVHVSGQHAAGPPTIIGVLPFELLGVAERDYLADGLTDEVIASLGQIDPAHIQVIGRTSVMSYKHTAKSIAEIGRELHADLLLESSMRTEGGRFRITSKLIRTSDQVQIWSTSYDAEPSSMLSFQRELSATIAEQIRLRLSPERLDALRRRQTENPEAYDSYLHGRYLWNHFTPATTRRAMECYTRATELDPKYALAWSGLTDAYSSAPIHADARPGDVWDKARTAAKNAISAEPELAETQTSLGMLKFWLEWDWVAAENCFRKAIRLDPSYSLAHRMLGIVLAHNGRSPEEARIAMSRARSLDPLEPMHHALSAQVGFITGDHQEALQFARQATIIAARFWIGYYQEAQVYEHLGEYEAALNSLERAANFRGANSKVLSLRGFVLAKQGKTLDALAVLETLKALSSERYFPPYATALILAGLGKTDLVFEWLNRAFDVHDVHLALLPADPKWDALRGDSRFTTLLKRCHLP